MAADPTSPVLLDRDDSGAVATIRFNRPEAMNALDTATKEALLGALREVADDRSVRCVVLTGTGRAFCVGQDLREHVRLLEQDAEQLWRTVPEHYNPAAELVAGMDKPVIAALNGVAAGAGASLAFAADLRYLSDAAGMNLAFAGIALSADTGSSWTLPRLVGTAKAKELLLLPRTVPADECLELGLATEVVPADRLDERVREVASSLAAGPTMAYGAIRRAIDHAWAHPLPEALEHEAELMVRTGTSHDHAEAVAAFLAKRTPDFTGR